jgi:hypothetical protein
VTEQEWLRETDPLPMVNHLKTLRWNRTRAGRRKLRLLGCACCRRIWRLIDDKGRRWVELAEGVADGLPRPTREILPFRLGTTSGQPDK